MKKGLIIETRVISEIRRQRELMGLKPVVLNEAAERIPFLNRVIKWIVGNAPETKLSDMLGGNAPQIMKRLQKLGINSIETLEKNLFDEAGTATRKIPTDVEKSIVKAFRKKVFTDPDLADLAKESVVDYFDRLGNLSNGVSVSETIENLLSADFTIPDVRKAADDLIAQLELRFGKDNEAVQYVKKSTEMKKVDNAFDDIDVNGPKVDDTNTPEPEPFFNPDEPININGSEAPNPDDIKFDFSDYNTNDVPDIEVEKIIDDIDYDALTKSLEPEPELAKAFSQSIENVANESRLFRSLSAKKKDAVIREIQADFVNTYNKAITDETKKIDAAFNDPAAIAKVEKMWNNIGTNPSAQAKFVQKALAKTELGAKFRMNTVAFWENYFTGKVPSTGVYPGPKQFFYNYIKAVGISAIIEGAVITKKLLYDKENIGWDNIPGNGDMEKAANLLHPTKALIKTILPGIGHIFVGFDISSDFLLNEYRKPSTDEVRKLLGIKTTSTVRVAEIATQNTKYAEYSRTVFIDDVNIGDYALRIKDKQLVAMKKGQPIPPDAVDANANAGGNTPAPAPAPVVKTTMTRAEVEAKAVSSTHGYVAPIRFTPNEDNKDSYDGIDKDGYKFIAKLVSGEIAITSNGKE